MSRTPGTSVSDAVREHARTAYVAPARREGKKSFSINVGEVHRATALRNRVPLVCQALLSEKFLTTNRLELVAKAGPPSGQSTTVTYTYEFIDAPTLGPSTQPSVEDTWNSMRGALKEVFAAYGGGEAYLRAERENFYGKESK